MKSQTKIYIAIAAVLAVATIAGATWSNHKIAKLENEVEAAIKKADGVQRLAAEKEKQAAEYKQKIDYLEQKFADIKTIARKQDEELEKFNNNSGRARADVERTRRLRSINATAAELCQKLTEIGHGCE